MTELRLYNTRTRSKDAFEPIDPNNVRMYVCGPTVYDRAHIGNARPVVVFDMVYRLLRHVYGSDHVTYVRNFTDVDDKIIDKAVATIGSNESLEAATRRITDETIEWYHQDTDALGALRPDHEPRCTEYIEPMVTIIEELIAKGHAYEAQGHALFSVDSFEKYGELSRRSTDDMIAGSRVEVAPYKKGPMDFVLWKPSTAEQPGWDSPWGRGRPGWHIECSAMADQLLWEEPSSEGTLSDAAIAAPHVFDIHAGGIDLQFPHHENELAQSRCAHGTERLANWWMHNEMLRVEGEKMSKSLGNFFTVRDLLDQGVPGEIIRFVLLSTHYRQPLDWTSKRVEEARGALNRWRNQTDGVEPSTAARSVVAALTDDLNTPRAIAELHKLSADGDYPALRASAQMLGLLTDALGGWNEAPVADGDVADLIESLLSDRYAARNAKDFARADAIRDGFVAAGVNVKDTSAGTEWHLTQDFDRSKLEALR
ncbi:MAG: cysteine--tRNA ligase [Pseudomonadota bacterium]